jgi:hypothetical protein
MPKPATGTGAWWLQRPVWIIVSVGVLWVLTNLFRRFEVHPAPAPDRTTDGGGVALMVISIGLALLGFGVTGFNRITESLGEGLLGFELNPLMSLVHLGLGLLLVSSLRWSTWPARTAAGLAVGAFLALAAAGYREGIEFLGTNQAMAALHLWAGGAGFLALGWQMARSMR